MVLRPRRRGLHFRIACTGWLCASPSKKRLLPILRSRFSQSQMHHGAGAEGRRQEAGPDGRSQPQTSRGGSDPNRIERRCECIAGRERRLSAPGGSRRRQRGDGGGTAAAMEGGPCKELNIPSACKGSRQSCAPRESPGRSRHGAATCRAQEGPRQARRERRQRDRFASRKEVCAGCGARAVVPVLFLGAMPAVRQDAAAAADTAHAHQGPEGHHPCTPVRSVQCDAQTSCHEPGGCPSQASRPLGSGGSSAQPLRGGRGPGESGPSTIPGIGCMLP